MEDRHSQLRGHRRTTQHVRGDGSFPQKRPIRMFPRRWRPMSSEWGITSGTGSRAVEKAEREASPTAAIIDSQSVKSAEKGGLHRSAWL
jgi:hypothetical protein